MFEWKWNKNENFSDGRNIALGDRIAHMGSFVPPSTWKWLVYKSSNEVWSAERKELGGCLASTCLAFVFVDEMSVCVCLRMHSFVVRMFGQYKCLFVSLLCVCRFDIFSFCSLRFWSVTRYQMHWNVTRCALANSRAHSISLSYISKEKHITLENIKRINK